MSITFLMSSLTLICSALQRRCCMKLPRVCCEIGSLDSTPDPRCRSAAAAAPYLNRIHLCSSSSLRRCRPQIRGILHPAAPGRRDDDFLDCLPVNLVNVKLGICRHNFALALFELVAVSKEIGSTPIENTLFRAAEEKCRRFCGS